MNNKAQQMTLETIIAMVLGIAVLVFLIYGFSIGWGNMWCDVTRCESSSEIAVEECEVDYYLEVLVKCIDMNETSVNFCYELTRIDTCENIEVFQ